MNGAESDPWNTLDLPKLPGYEFHSPLVSHSMLLRRHLTKLAASAVKPAPHFCVFLPIALLCEQV